MADQDSLERGAAGRDPVPHAVFNLDDVAGAQKYDLWRESISCIFEVEARPDIRDSGFNAEIDANMFGPLMLARTQTLKQRWTRSPSIMARDGMDHYMIQFYERGQMLWDTTKGSFSVPENGLVIFDLAQEVVVETNNFANLSLIVPREMLADQLKAADDQNLRILHNAEPMVPLLRDYLSSLKRLAPRITGEQALQIAPATVGLVAACLNAAVGDEPSQQLGAGLVRLTAMRKFIEANLSEPELSAEWICSREWVSRTKLYELFEAYGGVAAYVRERRMRRALLSLANHRMRHRPIYDIALASGYTSDTAFSRAFRSKYGVSPRDVRKDGVSRPSAARASDGVDRRYERWLSHLSV